MVPDPTKTSLGLEYFCTEGDTVWNMPDADLIELGKREVEHIGLARYADDRRTAVSFACQSLSGLRLRLPRLSGHRHGSSSTAWRTARRSAATGCTATTTRTMRCSPGCWQCATWCWGKSTISGASTPTKSTTRRYATGSCRPRCRGGGPAGAPMGLPEARPPGIRPGRGDGLRCAARPGDPLARAAGGGAVGPNLQLLSQYFPGYRVSVQGSFIGLAYALVTGFIVGWSFAFLRNAALFLCMAVVYRRAEYQLLRKLIEYL